jgi:hypothetical protein
MSVKDGIMRKASQWLVFPALLAVWLMAAGCDDPNDYDFKPSDGKGALIVDNISPDDIDVFVDGVRLGQVGDNDDRAFELAPGLHRVVLEEEDGRRDAADDIDILEGRLTVLRVSLPAFSSDRYDVSVDFQD